MLQRSDVPRPIARRVILVVLDGLRAELVGDARFPHLAALRAQSAYTQGAETVSPSVTAAAMTSLFVGVSPAEHGVRTDRFGLPPNLERLVPLPRVIADAGLHTAGVVQQVPLPLRFVARRIVRELGLAEAHFAPPTASALLARMLPALQRQRFGFIVMHWPDADAVGHRFGWMSPRYLEAVGAMDAALGTLRATIAADTGTVLLVTADHGGGGLVPMHHDSAHPLDTTIPILISGAGVRPHRLSGRFSLLDVPPTVLWALGLPVPPSWVGTPMTAAFDDLALAGHEAPPTRISGAVS